MRYSQKVVSFSVRHAASVAAVALGVYGAWFSSLPLSLDVRKGQIINYGTQNSFGSQNSVPVNDHPPVAANPDVDFSVSRSTRVSNELDAQDVEDAAQEVNENAKKLQNLKRHLTAPWGWVHFFIQTLGIGFLSIPVFRSAIAELTRPKEKGGKYFGISSQVSAGILFPTTTGFYNLLTNSFIPCCAVHLGQLMSIQNAAGGSGVNFVGYLFATSGALVLAAIAYLSENIESFVEKYSQKQVEKILSKDRLQKSYLIEKNDQTIEKPTSEIQVGDELIMRFGEALPVDGILQNNAKIVRDQLTGESDPIKLITGEKVFAGSVMKTRSTVKVQVTAVGENTSLARIKQLAVKAAQQKSNAAERVDNFAKIFSLGITLGAFGAYVWGALAGSYFLILYSLSVLFILTPCALKLSVPTLKAIFLMKFSNKNEMFIKNFASFEKASKVKHIFFDKTGTLVSHEKRITDQKFSEENDSAFTYALLEKIVQKSNHPVSKFFVEEAKNQSQHEWGDLKLDEVQEQEGGLKALWKNKTVLFGNDELLLSENFSNKELQSFGDFSNYLTLDGKILAAFYLQGELRKDALETVETLQKAGKKVFILSGDKQAETNRIAKLLNIPADQAFGKISPKNKMKVIMEHQEKFGPAMHVGDGINDAPALGAAVIGVSWNAQSIAAENADIVAFSGEKLSRIADLFSEQKKYNRLLWQNIVIPFAFNGALLYTVMTGIFGSLLVSIGGAVLSGFALPIAFLMHESVSFLAAGNSMRGYLDSSRSLFPLFKRLISKAA